MIHFSSFFELLKTASCLQDFLDVGLLSLKRFPKHVLMKNDNCDVTQKGFFQLSHSFCFSFSFSGLIFDKANIFQGLLLGLLHVDKYSVIKCTKQVLEKSTLNVLTALVEPNKTLKRAP